MAEESLEDKGEEFTLQIWEDRNVKRGERKRGKPGRHCGRQGQYTGSALQLWQLIYVTLYHVLDIDTESRIQIRDTV